MCSQISYTSGNKRDTVRATKAPPNSAWVKLDKCREKEKKEINKSSLISPLQLSMPKKYRKYS